MIELAQANIVVIVIALLVGIAVAWLLFARSRKTSVRIESDTSARSSLKDAPAFQVPEADPVPSRTLDTHEGNGIVDEGAAAATDVYGEILGAQAHRELPGAEAAPDRLDTMKGVGPKFVTKLNELGITRFEQLAALTPGELAALDERLGAFRGRLERDRIAEQAGYLARGDREGFEAIFGKLG
jgi:predicted flap endonuclease-1-like 5' DNA nuclease